MTARKNPKPFNASLVSCLYTAFCGLATLLWGSGLHAWLPISTEVDADL